MDDVQFVSTYRQGRTVLVEVVGRDEHGEVHVVSYEFDRVDPGAETGRVEPCRSLEDPHRPPIREALVDDGYEVTIS